MSNEMRCKTCGFFKELDAVNDPGRTDGECMFHPPRKVTDKRTVRPLTDKDDWCSGWEPGEGASEDFDVPMLPGLYVYGDRGWSRQSIAARDLAWVPFEGKEFPSDPTLGMVFRLRGAE